MKILVTGGCGYKGAVLVPKLLAVGHEVRVFDTQWFGANLKDHPAMELIKGDIRGDVPMDGIEAVIHLAGIANDPCGELDAKLTWEVNVLAHHFLCDAAVRAGVRRFIYASSASVYGLKGDRAVTEDDTMSPVSDYNKTKMCAERILLSYADRMNVQIVRPATVCGISPRQRLDTMVNMLTVQALKTGKIQAHCGEHGGGLMRPNVHIDDITDLYCWLIDHPEVQGVFNAGFENISAQVTAEMIRAFISAQIEITKVKDKRSYLVDSSKLLSFGFRPRYKVADAIMQIHAAWKTGTLKDSDEKYNLRWMQQQGLVRS